MHDTLNSLKIDVRGSMAELLNQQLNDCIELRSRAKSSHWNVRGPRFSMLHELFDRVAGVAEELSDELAERCVQLGGTAEGTVFHAAQKTRLVDPRRAPTTEDQHVEYIARSLAGFAASARAAIDVATAAGDQATADLFTQVVREIDKLTWMVESHR